MKQSDMLFMVLYGGAFLIVFYFIVKFLYNPVDKHIYENTVRPVWPWSNHYNHWPKWNGWSRTSMYRMPHNVDKINYRPWGGAGRGMNLGGFH